MPGICREDADHLDLEAGSVGGEMHRNLRRRDSIARMQAQRAARYRAGSEITLHPHGESTGVPKHRDLEHPWLAEVDARTESEIIVAA